MEQLVNGAAATQLNGAILSGTTSIVVDDGSVFPSSGNFRIRIENEILLVTARSTNTLTVTRGQEGTGAVAHADNTPVDFCLTADGYEQFMSEYIGEGAWASRPASGFNGQIYIANDAPFISRYNGSAWEEFGPAGVHKMMTSGFSLVNGGTLVDTGSLLLTSAASATDAVRAYTVGYSGTPKNLICRLVWSYAEADFGHAGLCWRESSSGKLALHGLFQTNAAARYFQQKFDNPTTYNSDYGAFVSGLQFMAFNFRMNWMRLLDDGTDRVFYISNNGREWIEIHRVARTNFLTPNEFGFFIKSNANVASSIRVNFLSIE